MLLVDDEPAVAAAHARLLRRSGFRVEVCTESVRALERLTAGERFDVVICDGRMPELRGVELFQRARLAWPELEERILFLSGGMSDEDARFIREHALPFLAKPLRRVDDLADAIRELVARRRAHVGGVP